MSSSCEGAVELQCGLAVAEVGVVRPAIAPSHIAGYRVGESGRLVRFCCVLCAGTNQAVSGWDRPTLARSLASGLISNTSCLTSPLLNHHGIATDVAA